MSASSDLQRAVYQALTTALVDVPVYDSVPQHETSTDLDFPFVTIGEDNLLEWDTDLKNGYEATLTVHVWSRARGRLELKDIQSAIYGALHRADFAVGDYGVLGFTFINANSFLDPDGLTRHGVQQFKTFFAEI